VYTRADIYASVSYVTGIRYSKEERIRKMPMNQKAEPCGPIAIGPETPNFIP